MTKERLQELSCIAYSLETQECVAEIERLQADRDHWRTEYKTLELAGDILLKNNCKLKVENERMAEQFRLVKIQAPHLFT